MNNNIFWNADVCEPKNMHDLLISDIVGRLKKITKRGCEVVFCCVPSHVGIAGNEKVDEIVKLVIYQRRSWLF